MNFDVVADLDNIHYITDTWHVYTATSLSVGENIEIINVWEMMFKTRDELVGF